MDRNPKVAQSMGRASPVAGLIEGSLIAGMKEPYAIPISRFRMRWLTDQFRTYQQFFQGFFLLCHDSTTLIVNALQNFKRPFTPPRFSDTHVARVPG
jgi:hypothetical protein